MSWRWADQYWGVHGTQTGPFGPIYSFLQHPFATHHETNVPERPGGLQGLVSDVWPDLWRLWKQHASRKVLQSQRARPSQKGGSGGTTSGPTVRSPPSEECRKCKTCKKSSPRPPAAILAEKSSSDQAGASTTALTHVCSRGRWCQPLPALSYIRELYSQHIRAPLEALGVISPPPPSGMSGQAQTQPPHRWFG